MLLSKVIEQGHDASHPNDKGRNVSLIMRCLQAAQWRDKSIPLHCRRRRYGSKPGGVYGIPINRLVPIHSRDPILSSKHVRCTSGFGGSLSVTVGRSLKRAAAVGTRDLSVTLLYHAKRARRGENFYVDGRFEQEDSSAS